jgi:hypothetical protein
MKMYSSGWPHIVLRLRGSKDLARVRRPTNLFSYIISYRTRPRVVCTESLLAFMEVRFKAISIVR